MSGWGTLPLLSVVKPRPVVEVLMETAVKNVKFNGIKVKVYRRIDMFEQTLHEVIASFLPDCVMGMDIVPNWGIFPPPRIIKQRHANPPFKQY